MGYGLIGDSDTGRSTPERPVVGYVGEEVAEADFGGGGAGDFDVEAVDGSGFCLFDGNRVVEQVGCHGVFAVVRNPLFAVVGSVVGEPGVVVGFWMKEYLAIAYGVVRADFEFIIGCQICFLPGRCFLRLYGEGLFVIVESAVIFRCSGCG